MEAKDGGLDALVFSRYNLIRLIFNVTYTNCASFSFPSFLFYMIVFLVFLFCSYFKIWGWTTGSSHPRYHAQGLLRSIFLSIFLLLILSLILYLSYFMSFDIFSLCASHIYLPFITIFFAFTPFTHLNFIGLELFLFVTVLFLLFFHLPSSVFHILICIIVQFYESRDTWIIYFSFRYHCNLWNHELLKSWAAAAIIYCDSIAPNAFKLSFPPAN